MHPLLNKYKETVPLVVSGHAVQCECPAPVIESGSGGLEYSLQLALRQFAWLRPKVTFASPADRFANFLASSKRGEILNVPVLSI